MTCPHGNTLTCLKCWDEEESAWEQAAHHEEADKIRARQESPHYTYRRTEHMRGVDEVDPHND